MKLSVPALILALASTSSEAYAQLPACPAELAQAWSAVAPQAIEQWSQANRIIVDTDVAASIRSQFCVSSASQKNSAAASADQFRNALSLTIREYLDSQVGLTDQGPTFNALLGANLGSPGLSRPTARIYGRIKVTYTVGVDAVKLRGKTYAPFSTFLLTTGKATFEGFTGNTPTCAVQVDVKAAPDASIQC